MVTICGITGGIGAMVIYQIINGENTKRGNTTEKQGGSNGASTTKTVGTRTVFRDQSDTLGAKARCGFESHPTDICRCTDGSLYLLYS